MTRKIILIKAIIRNQEELMGTIFNKDEILKLLENLQEKTLDIIVRDLVINKGVDKYKNEKNSKF